MVYELIEQFNPAFVDKNLKRGEVIYHEGSPPDALYFVEDGLVGLFHVTESGKESFLRVFTKGDILGHRSYFAHEEYHASAIALTKTRLRMITKEKVDGFLQENPKLLYKLLELLAKDLGKAELRMASLVDKSANARIAESLVCLKLKYPNQTWTRKEIAEYSGSTLESVTRLMSQLAEEGLIVKQGRDFSFEDHNKILEKFEL